MTAKEIAQLVKVLQSCGVTSYETKELKLRFGPPEATASPYALTAAVPRAPAPPSRDDDKPPEHKITELTSLMKLGDEDLLERLFPDHTDADVVTQ